MKDIIERNYMKDEIVSFRLILHRYIISEIIPIFFMSLIVFIFAMVSTKLLSITRWLVEHNGSLNDFLKMILYIQPSVIFFAMPASLLISTLVCFLRLSGDNEIVAIQSSGISLFQLLYPVIFISSLAMLLSFLLALILIPKGNGLFKDTIFEILKRRPDMGIKEHVFCEPFNGITFYVGHFDSNKRVMKDVFIVDRREPEAQNTVFAKRGRIIAIPDQRRIMIILEQGTVSSVTPDFNSTRTIRFGTYRINVSLEDIAEGISSRKKTLNEMGLRELRNFIINSKKRNVKYYEAMIEYYEKFSIPIAVFFMGIIGVPLGTQLRYGGKPVGIITGIIVFLLYYMSISGVRSIGETGKLNPSIGVWIPVLLIVIPSTYLLMQSSRGYRLKIFEKALWFMEKRRLSHTAKTFPELDIKEKTYYIGNIKMNKFHRPSCRWAKKISSGNRIIFLTREGALKKDYDPCRVCKP